MSAATPIVRDWRATVAGQLLPRLHGHTAKAVADLSFAMARAGHCQAGRLASHVPTPAQPASAQRRCERLLDNPRLRPRLAQRQLATALLASWTGRTIRLLLDETPKANDLRVLNIRVAYRHRALPLAAVCYRPHALPQPMPQLVRSLLRQVHACVPAGARVVLLADRGLAWPLLVDWCQEHDWHYVLRLTGQTRVRFPDGSERAACALATRPGQRWLGAAEVFKKAGWRGANVVATWERGMKEAWLLLTDEPASLRHCRTYGKRMWVEESHRDDKSAAFHWEKSQVNDPAHALRLLLLIALAMVLAASQGSVAQKAGRRRQLDPHRRRRLSIVQLGLRWLRYALEHDLQGLVNLSRLYLYPD
jgi:Transposase DDE domain